EFGNLGGPVLGNVAVGLRRDGRLHMFALAWDGTVWQRVEQAPRGAWTAWAAVGGSVSMLDFTVGQNQDGRLELFARASDGSLQQSWEIGTSGTFANWYYMSGTGTSRPAVVRNADGRLTVLVRGLDHAVWQKSQNAPNSGWGAWSSLGGDTL